MKFQVINVHDIKVDEKYYFGSDQILIKEVGTNFLMVEGSGVGYHFLNKNNPKNVFYMEIKPFKLGR